MQSLRDAAVSTLSTAAAEEWPPAAPTLQRTRTSARSSRCCGPLWMTSGPCWSSLAHRRRGCARSTRSRGVSRRSGSSSNLYCPPASTCPLASLQTRASTSRRWGSGGMGSPPGSSQSRLKRCTSWSRSSAGTFRPTWSPSRTGGRAPASGRAASRRPSSFAPTARASSRHRRTGRPAPRWSQACGLTSSTILRGDCEASKQVHSR
mmetsp:Transcript_774/g.2252  ORF Transcript_774/g.2252 Transcript_774/m.2252 type:complete len:206 (-) Transcript_774:502-1119(-)